MVVDLTPASRGADASADAPFCGGLAAVLRDGGRPLLLLLLAGALVRGVGLDKPLWLDEILMLHDFVRRPAAAIVTSFPNDNNHPLYSLAAAASERVVGSDPVPENGLAALRAGGGTFARTAVAIRLPAFLFGVASLGALYALVRLRASRTTALLAVALLAASARHADFSQNARGYTALLLCALAATRSFLRARDGAPRAEIPCALALGLGAYAHLTGAFVGVAFAAAQLLLPAAGGRFAAGPWRGILGGGAFAALLYAPMADDLRTFFFARQDRVAVASAWKDPWFAVRETLAGFGATTLAAGAAAVAIAAVVGFAGLRALARKDRALPVLLLLPAALGAVATVALGRHLWPRFFFFAFGGALWIAVEGVAALVGRLRAGAVAGPSGRAATRVLAAIAVASALTLPGAWAPKQDFRNALVAADPAAFFGASASEPFPRLFSAGLALWPCRYLHAPEAIPVALDPAEKPVDDPAPLLAALAGPDRDRVRVVACSPVFMASRQPKVWALLQERFRRVAAPRADGGVGPEPPPVPRDDLEPLVYAPR